MRLAHLTGGLSRVLCFFCVAAAPSDAAAAARHLSVPSAFAESWGHVSGAVRMNHQGTLFAGQPIEEQMEIALAVGLYPECAGAPLEGADLLFTVQQPTDRGLRAIFGWKLQLSESRNGCCATALSLIACGAADDQGYLAADGIASFRSRGGRVGATAGFQAGVGGNLRGGDALGGVFAALGVRVLWALDAHLEFGGNLDTGFALAGVSLDLGPNVRTYFALPVNIVISDELETLEPQISGGVQFDF